MRKVTRMRPALDAASRQWRDESTSERSASGRACSPKCMSWPSACVAMNVPSDAFAMTSIQPNFRLSRLSSFLCMRGRDVARGAPSASEKSRSANHRAATISSAPSSAASEKSRRRPSCWSSDRQSPRSDESPEKWIHFASSRRRTADAPKTA